MASDLMLPSGLAPSNLHLRPGVNARYVENDIFDIAKRVRAVDESLHIIELEEDGRVVYAIMEHGRDGIERLVFRVSELDGRVVERLRYLMAMPLHERLDKLEEEELRANASKHEDDMDELYERVGRPMWTELEKCGFIQRSVSYPKTGVAGGKGSKGKH